MMLLALLLGASAPGDVILTRAQAEASPPADLTQRLLAGFPHGIIQRVEVYSNTTWLPMAPLTHVIFHEQARPAGGRFCAARRIVATFDRLPGQSPDALASGGGTLPQRLSNVSSAPLMAVLEDDATDAACASTRRFAQLPLREPERGRRVVEQVLSLAMQARETGKVAVPVSCTDQMGGATSPCEATRALATLDWSTLSNVDLPSSIRGPTTQLQFWANGTWVVEVTGGDQVASLTLRRTLPPPF